MSTFFKHSSVLRILIVTGLVLFATPHMFGAGFTPTDGGLVVNLKTGDRILLSVMIDEDNNPATPDVEYFVCFHKDYKQVAGDRFPYVAGNTLKLLKQDAGATEPSIYSIWNIGAPVKLIKGGRYDLDGIAYTMWSSTTPKYPPYTLITSGGSFKYQGALDKNDDHNNICNAIFVVPTDRGDKVTSFDPNNTMGRGAKFDGEKGYGFLGLPYREVYWLDIPRSNAPISYTNASVISFNTTLSDYKYSNNAETATPGQAMYAFADDKHKPTKRTIFRLYVLDESVTSSCPDSYFFAYDEQDEVRYKTDLTQSTYTASRKIYTIDRLVCMDRVPGTKYYQCWTTVPEPDNTYFYVGKKNKYCHDGRSEDEDFDSQFKNISELTVQHLGLPAPRGAYGRMIVDTTNTDEQNLGVEFAPGGYFLRTNTGRNIRMKPNAEGNIWTCEEMWHITAEYAALTIKATMFTGNEFSDDDEGADIPGWSVPVVGTSVPVIGAASIINQNGWARIHIDSTDPNGHIEFVLANATRHIRYDNNGCLGDTVPDQYPLHGETSVTVEAPRLEGGFNFTGWNTAPDGSGTTYLPGAVLNLPEGTTTLYAIATYSGTYHVALSFVKDDGKRYFLTHPGSAAPRYSRARCIDDWTNAWQGMANADNVDNHYINTFKLLNDPVCGPGEMVLDPRREMRHGSKDSLLFYEDFAPAAEEYLGLYYTDPNVLLANTTWAGLFTSSAGWPNYSVADVQNTKLRSTHYLHRVDGVLTRDERSNSAASYVKYNAAENQFDGEASEANATVFQISRVRVADEHYVVIPDTTIEWTDEIVFGIHQDKQTVQEVWSKLIGKQLMAMMKFGNDTVYFHPNNDKILTDATQLSLNANYRLEQTFTYIRDARVESLLSVDDANKPHMSTSSNDFGRVITSGMSTPMDVIYQGEYIDIVDTLRISLSTRGPVKIKEYYGRWRDGAPGLHVLPDGSRYRDIIVRTKTTHYGEDITRLALTPEYPMYNFPPLASSSKPLTFTLTKITAHQLLDTDGNVLGEEVLTSDDLTVSLRLQPTHCSFTSGGTYFSVDNENTLNDHVTLVTKTENISGVNHDTLIINQTARVDDVDYPLTCRIPLQQSALSGSELIWSAVAGGKRYFIMADTVGLIFRQFQNKSNILYKNEDGKTQLLKGSKNAANNDTRYITPWSYTPEGAQQLTLKTEYGVDRYFVVNGSSEPDVASSSPTVLTYEYVHEYVNDNANFEEQVTLKYGSDRWLKFEVGVGGPSLTLTASEAEASVFSWSYLQQEYYLLNNGTYPDKNELVFDYNNNSGIAVQTRYKAYRIYSMLLDNKLTYCCREDENDIADLVSSGNDWKTNNAINIVGDSRFSAGASGLSKTTDGNLTTTVTPAGDSPTEVRYPAGTGPFVDIVDTLDVQISLKDGAPAYRFADKWSSFTSVNDAHLKIPLVRKTFHAAPYDSLTCSVESDEYMYVFPAEIVTDVNDTHTFTLHTTRHSGTNILSVENQVAAYSGTSSDLTSEMDFTDPSKAEIRLIDEYGNTPGWCEVSAKGTNTITVRCKQNGIRSPRSANLYIAYMMQLDARWRFVNFRLSVAQSSRFQYANNQTLTHSKGASGDSLVDGVQQVHENRNIIYYYNPSNAAQSTDQRVELPVRERNFYGWWRWYSLQPSEEDTDIPAEKWQTPPTNIGKWNFPFRIIGDSVWIDEENPALGKKLVTQGRYTVFHYPSNEYNARKDPPSKAPMVYPPQDKAVVTYALDKSVYYDNLPLSMKNVNQVDTAKLDKMMEIIEPTLSLREIYELHPWTEMADTMENYKSANGATYPLASERYLEDHVVRAPRGNRLLLSTEQRYNYDNIKKGGHSESLMGYYMKDDNWSTWDGNTARQDTMIWCGGWDVDCKWFTYNKASQTYSTCSYTLTEANDFLNVPANNNAAIDTVIYCLRARSKATSVTTEPNTVSVDGAYWFNICRYTIIYHNRDQYGPKLENASGVSIITNDEIEQHYEILERLNFDYNKPGSDYQVYPHPLPWEDASYGFAYPKTPELPDNRPHNATGLENLANMGEYNLINKIPSFGTYWYKMEQHGGAENGYMIFCDGMSSAGQVAAISLHKKLCEGQKMYFSAYVGNPGSQTGNKSCPNFLFSVQGKQDRDGAQWEDITSYMTGDLAQSDKWYQIYFPIEQKNDYEHFRVRVYNTAANDDGNDFIIDDMCIFATKPPLIAYQANTTCMQEGETDNVTHVVLRVDYQGFHDKGYNNADVFYTVEQVNDNGEGVGFVTLVDGYINQAAKGDTIYGVVHMPSVDYEPSDDSIFNNVSDLVSRFEASLAGGGEKFRVGYIKENLDGVLRPVMYIIHKAEMIPHNHYRVRMSLAFKELTSSICAMTSNLKISNRMMLELNGEEQPDKEIAGMCANTTYDVSLRVRGSMLQDHAAPADINGSCVNDWLLYGDSTSTSEARYGYKYSDIEKIIKDILRCDPKEAAHNTNQFARNLSEVNRNELEYVKTSERVTLTTSDHPYDVLAHLVNAGFLTLYRSNMTITTSSGDSIQYMIFPIVGTGSDAMLDMEVDVCPTPVFVKLKATAGGEIPMAIGGFNPEASPTVEPPVILADEATANSEIVIPIDKLMLTVALDTIAFLSTNDPNYLEGIHKLHLLPNKEYNLSGDNSDYYETGDDLILRPAPDYNYQMRPGYNYTYGITMMTRTGSHTLGDGCRVGTVPFTISVVPNAVRWDPKEGEDNNWNNPDNWIGVNAQNQPIHPDAHFVPKATTNVIIPAMTGNQPSPVMPDPSSIAPADSVKKTGFEYNVCDAIRFLPGAAMGQQQYLTYNTAVVDMSLPHNQWAFRSAPVTGMLSGDIFMANADLTNQTPAWETGEFDANGRNATTGNASFWLSLYSRSIVQKGNGNDIKDSTRTAAAQWSRVTNGMDYYLPPALGWAIYTRTANGNNAAVRLPKNDDIYYYYNTEGEKMYDFYVPNLCAERNENAGSAAGKLAFDTDGTYKEYTLENDSASTAFVFGNPTMGYIDIWGFIADNSLAGSIDYMASNNVYTTIARDAAEATRDTITNPQRYLPPMHAMVISTTSGTSKTVRINTNRIVTSPSQVVRPAPAPHRIGATGLSKGIMTVTAVNPVSSRCTSRLLIGQGYHSAILDGEDALLTTVNINNYTNTSAPATPFNIYAVEGEHGLSINLRDEVLNVPVSFYMSDLPYDPVTHLWFTGVNNIEGQLVLYDALTNSERLILDGIRLDIPTPEASHETRYYIRRRGFDPSNPDLPITTAIQEPYEQDAEASAIKIIKDGHVLILRDGHIYTMFGQKLR